MGKKKNTATVTIRKKQTKVIVEYSNPFFHYYNLVLLKLKQIC